MFRFHKLRSLDFQLISQDNQNQSPATLQSVQYKCQIINNILNIHLTQNFVSLSNSEYSETIYYFPIQDGVCFELFQAKYNEKTIKGIVKGKDVAKKEYQENKSEGNFVTYAQTTTIQDQDYCKIELGNLPPNQQVEITIVFSQQLNSLLNKYYVAQIPLIYCEDEISAKLGKNVLTLDIFCTGRITYSESKGYPAEKIMLDDNTARFNVSQALLQKDTDFQLIFSYEGMFDPQIIFGQNKIFNEDSVKSAILPVSYSAMVSFIPNFNESITQEIDDSVRAAINNGDDIFSDEFQQRLNQELIDHLNSSRSEFIFLLDRSGSMSGQPIRRACEALTLFLKSLPNDSYFNVISFGSSFEKLFPTSIKYTTDSLEKAVLTISKYNADLGGTEIYNPLNNVFVQNKIQGYNKQIFLLTDGEVDSPQQVVKLIKKNNKFNRVHSIGFGSGADQYLIEESAKAGKGISKVVDQKCDLSEVIINMLCLCITPTLDDFKIKYDQSIFDSTYPSSINFPCIFKDEIINIHFFLKSGLELGSLTEEQKKIEIEYFDSYKKQKVQKEIKLEMQDSFTCNPQLQQSVFKIGKQLFLNENMLDESQNSQLIQQAIDYQLLTQKTALICVIETLNDEQKIMYQNLNHHKKYSNLTQNYQSNLNLPQISHTNLVNSIGQFGSLVPPPPPLPLNPINVSKGMSFSQPPLLSAAMSQNFSSPQAPQLPNFPVSHIQSQYAAPFNFASNSSSSFSGQQPNLSSCLPPPPPPCIGGFGMKLNMQQQPLHNSFTFSNQISSHPPPPPPQGLNFSPFQVQQAPQFQQQQQQLMQQQQQQYQPLKEQLQEVKMEMEENDFLTYDNENLASEDFDISANISSSPSNSKKVEKILDKIVNEIQTQNSSLPSISNNNNNKISLPKLEDLLNLVNSSGIWKFDPSLISKLTQQDESTFKHLYSQFTSNDGFMTLLILIILETKYSQQKSKWVLISKKSLTFVKNQLNQGIEFSSVKSNISSLISN